MFVNFTCSTRFLLFSRVGLAFLQRKRWENCPLGLEHGLTCSPSAIYIPNKAHYCRSYLLGRVPVDPSSSPAASWTRWRVIAAELSRMPQRERCCKACAATTTNLPKDTRQPWLRVCPISCHPKKKTGPCPSRRIRNTIILSKSMSLLKMLHVLT